jgi:predicted transcriptional regulator
VKRVQIAGHLLPAAEAEVLKVLLAEGPLLVADVQARLSGRQWAHTTVGTLLGRLVDRGLVEREPEGKGHRYGAVGSEAELAALALEQALQGVDDPTAALQAFLGRLTPGARRRLRQGLSERERG